MKWYSPKYVERIVKIKSNHKNFVHLVGLYTYCRMMHSAYNVNYFVVVYLLAYSLKDVCERFEATCSFCLQNKTPTFLKLKAVYSFSVSVNTYQTAQCFNPKKHPPNIHHYENLKFMKLRTVKNVNSSCGRARK